MDGKKEAVLEAYRRTGSQTKATAAAGIARSLHYHWLKRDPEYRRGFGEAVAQVSAGRVAGAATRADEMGGKVAGLVEGIKPDGRFDRTADVALFKYWDEIQFGHGCEVRSAVFQAARAIITNVPAGADRSLALRKLREVRILCNWAITKRGKGSAVLSE